MKVIIRGKKLENIFKAIDIISIQKISIVDNFPELVIVYGGDGTLLEAEREFPCIKKLLIRNNIVGTNEYIINIIYDNIIDFLQNKVDKTKLIKIVGKFQNIESIVLNDISIISSNRQNAIRYNLYIDKELYIEEEIGDGVVISTPHGSSAYFNSVTNCTFRYGIGVAFNNSRKHTSHIIINEDSNIEIEILRGIGLLMIDGFNINYFLKSSERLLIYKYHNNVILYGLKKFKHPILRK